MSERDFEDITIRIEYKVSKRIKDDELGQRETLRKIENLSLKVDSPTGSNLGPCSSNRGVNSRGGSLEGNAQNIKDSHLVTQEVSYDTVTNAVMSPV